MEPKTEKLTLLETYRLTQETLLVAADNPDLFQEGRKEKSIYFERRRKENLEMRKAELRYLIDTLEYQIANYHPELRRIFMPRAAIKEYNFGKVRGIIPPQRWEEPLVQYFLKGFAVLMSQHDSKIGINNGHIDSDPIYSGIMNPDIRNAILQRTMTEQEYRRLEKILKNQMYSLPSGQITTALVKQSREISPVQEVERKLDNISPTVLAVEADLHPQTVRGHRKVGLSGQEIVDEGFMITELETNASVIHALRKHNISQDQWGDIIDASRQNQIPVTMLLRTMGHLGVVDMQEVLNAVEELGDGVTEYAATHRRRRKSEIWYNLLNIYSGVGRGDVYKTWDVFVGRYGSESNEELLPDISQIEKM